MPHFDIELLIEIAQTSFAFNDYHIIACKGSRSRIVCVSA